MTDLMLEPARTALVLIDLQPRLVRLPSAPRSGASVVAAAKRLADGFRDVDVSVVAVRVVRSEGEHSDPGAPDNQPVAELGISRSDIVITKQTWGAFHRTNLDAELREHGVQTLVLGGIATNMGVESTARAAVEHGYRVVFAEDAMAGLATDEHLFAVERIFPRLGTVSDTDALVRAVQTTAATRDPCHR